MSTLPRYLHPEPEGGGPPPAAPTIQVRSEGLVAVVSFLGKKIVADEDIRAMESGLDGLVEAHGYRQLVLDFAQVQYLSSSALGRLMVVNQKLRARGGTMKLCGLPVNLQDLFKSTRLVSVFELYDDLESALAAT